MNNNELFEALSLLEKERGIPVDYMVMQIKKAILIACKNTYGGNDDALIVMNPKNGAFEVYLQKTVVDIVEDSFREITLEQAREIDANAAVGEKVGIELEPKQFGRIAVQTARSIIRQGIRDGERDQMLMEFQSKQHELVSALIERVDNKTGNATIKIGKAEAILTKSEQVGNEHLREGDHIKVYIVDVKESEKGPKAVISRTHPDFVKRLFETEVPEIFDGTVEIKSVSREAGSRTKLAVCSRDNEVDAVGACIGTRGARVTTIVDELGGEKIDVIEYSDDPKKFIAASLSPANVTDVVLGEEGTRSCTVTVPDTQLSLAIGNKGQNARLAAKLTGYKIDIRPESGFFGEE
ncbi:MAG: transcription termination factor NusA [Bacillota bacterium]|nr:transcription termination factor NusA [Bacillota bacterium]